MFQSQVFASLPSPSSNELVFFGLHLRFYGLMIAIGVLCAVELTRRRWKATGGNPDDISTIALWAVPAGLIGARIYHVATDWKSYSGHWADALKIQNGGLGIPGGIALGVLAGVYVAKRKGFSVAQLLDAAAPAIPLAQAIGRLGNWFNQELFGRPTSLPWGLKIDASHRPVEYLTYSTFHPTFLYEALWNIALCLLLIWLTKKNILRTGNLFVVYIGSYFLGRFWVESLRSDHASILLGLRVNTWMSMIVIAGSIIVLLKRGVYSNTTDTDEFVVEPEITSPET